MTVDLEVAIVIRGSKGNIRKRFMRVLILNISNSVMLLKEGAKCFEFVSL
jgi:hypothetical protein